MPDSNARSIRRLAVLGSYVPRRCGLATFTRDLRHALVHELPELDCLVVAMNDGEQRYPYAAEVRCHIDAEHLESYRRAADFLNRSSIDALSVQHEFGLFGGEAGLHLARLMEAVKAPILTTLHTILAEPSETQRAAMDRVLKLSSRLVAMSEHGASLLRGVYGVESWRIDVVPHGAPDVPPDAGAKASLGLAGRRILLTHGLLSPDQGIEHAIGALPAIAARYPGIIYLVVGVTHPDEIASRGEQYREGLAQHAERLGMEGHVELVDRVLTQAELVTVLAAADAIIAPYLNPEQTTSGPLADALGAGKPVISTPFPHARELLAEGHGVLVPWRSSEGIARAVIDLFGDRARLAAVSARAAERGKTMAWPKVARGYWKAFAATCTPASTRPAPSEPRVRTDFALPALDLSHLRVLTDSVGVLQHALHSVPRYDEGYTLDDNARALLLTTALIHRDFPDPALRLRLETTYLAFIQRAFDGQRGRFRNFMSYGRVWLEAVGSEDSHGRALWSLGSAMGSTEDATLRVAAESLFRAGLRVLPNFTSPRAWAFALLGIDASLARSPEEPRLGKVLRATADRLHELFERVASPDWPWCEEVVTYANARVPHALIAAGTRLGDERMVATGLRGLAWLLEIQRSNTGDFSPVGTNGFFRRGGVMATFDQQPIEAGATVAACLRAFGATQDQAWLRRARGAFAWFLGKNHLERPVFDASTGGCRDGVHVDRMNENQGAESTLAFLQALSDLDFAQRDLITELRSEKAHHDVTSEFPGAPRAPRQ